MSHFDHRTDINRRQALGILAGSAAAATFASPLWSASETPSRKPNVIIIFTDDQGYQDIGCFGAEEIATPRLDRMAKEGRRFTDFYCASPVCTPSRTGLLTGCYPARLNLARGVLFPHHNIGLNPDEVTIADMLKAEGYATTCIGKWHLGHHPEFLPTRQGFDHYFGIPYSNDMGTKNPDGKRGVPLYRDEKVIEHPVDQSTLTERYTAEALKFIEQNKARPFFLYLPHTFPHVPLFASDRFRGKSKGRLYGDVIEAIDWSTGQILDKLTELGIDRDTLVIFTSDNGPWLKKGPNGGSALPLREGKGTTYEGGMRVPCIMRWPGRIPADSTCGEMALTLDLLPTIAAITGTRPPRDRIIDGKSILPLIEGDRGAATPHEAFYFYNTAGQLASVRSGDWKLHLARTASVRRKKNKQGKVIERTIPARPAELYDLSKDIGEQNNLAGQNPQVVARLTAVCEKFDAHVTQAARPVGRLPETP